MIDAEGHSSHLDRLDERGVSGVSVALLNSERRPRCRAARDLKVERSMTQVEISSAQAPGVQFRAALSGEPDRIEVYSLPLGRRLLDEKYSDLIGRRT